MLDNGNSILGDPGLLHLILDQNIPSVGAQCDSSCFFHHFCGFGDNLMGVLWVVYFLA